MEIRGKGLSFILALVLVLNLIVLVSLGLEYVGASGLTRLQWFALGGTGIAALLSLRAFKLSSELRNGLRRRDTLMRLLWLD
jgi:hypothetical protein